MDHQKKSVQIFIDETQEVYLAEVVEIGARVDPVSQTIRVFGQFKEQPKQVLAGMSGSARFTDRKLISNTKKSTFKPSTSASPTASAASIQGSLK